MKPIRVLEIRAARNGWVVTAIERESGFNRDTAAIYCTLVAETPEKAADICRDMMKEDSWDQAVQIMPARPESM